MINLQKSTIPWDVEVPWLKLQNVKSLYKSDKQDAPYKGTIQDTEAWFMDNWLCSAT